MTRAPESVRDLVRQLGGPQNVAQRLGVTGQAVGNWQLRGAIPRRHHLALWQMAQRAGLEWQPPGTDGLALAPIQPAQAA